MNPVTLDARSYLYFAADLRQAARFENSELARTTERHHIELQVPPLDPVANASAELSATAVDGAVLELTTGLPSAAQLQLIDLTLRGGLRAWVHWPGEEVVECVDAERLRSLRRHVFGVAWLKRICEPVDRGVKCWERLPTGLRWIYRGEFPVRRSDIFIKLNLLSLRAQPVAFDPTTCREGVFHSPEVGVYLRTDYWATPDRDDRTGRLAKELASIGEQIVCLTPRRDPWLDEVGVHQVVMDGPRQRDGQDAIVLAPTHYEPIVKAACQALRPAFLYERLAAGESVGAELSQLLRIPYIVEHQGSEALLQEALSGAAPVFSELYSQAEELALRQATVVLVRTSGQKEALVSRGIDASRVMVEAGDDGVGRRLAAFIAARTTVAAPGASIRTGDAYKDQVQNQWDNNPVGSQHARKSQPHTLGWFLEIEQHRYATYAPWMGKTMEFAGHAGRDVLEIGGGVGTDLAQFASHGATVTDLDLSAGHLRLAEENFRLRGLEGRFIHHDGESLPFADRSFDLVYSNGVLHHTPNTLAVVHEVHRVLRPGGRAIVMVYAENSLHYWRKLVWQLGVQQRLLERASMGEIMSGSVERTANDAKPLVKVYTRPRLRQMFAEFARVEIVQRQLLAEELPYLVRWTLPVTERCLGWNLIIKAGK